MIANNILVPPVRPSRARPLSVQVVTGEADAIALQDEWSALLRRCERSELTQSPDWLLTWWNVFGGLEGRQLRLGVCRAGNRLVGLAPLLRRWYWHKGCLPFRRLEFLGSGERDDVGIYSNHLSMLAECGFENEVVRNFVQAIVDGAFGNWDEVVLPMMSAERDWPTRLVTAFQDAGVQAEAKTQAGAPFIQLPATWDDFLASLSANSRHNIRRGQRSLEEWAGGTVALECITRSADLERGKQILVDLHHERWTGQGLPGVFRSPLYLDFHDHMMQTLADRGDLEMLILHARGMPVAALYTMLWDNKVYAYQAGRSLSVPPRLRPGSVLQALAIRRAIEMNRYEFDLLANDAFYKRELTSTVRPLIYVRATRPSLTESVRRIAVSGAAALRRTRSR